MVNRLLRSYIHLYKSNGFIAQNDKLANKASNLEKIWKMKYNIQNISFTITLNKQLK